MSDQVIVRLIEKGLTITTAESCTGGLLAGRIVDTPGSSAVFPESFVTYSNEAKTARRGVSPATLATRGAVSAECAVQMAEGARARANTDFALATTGIAGPEGGSDEKPVGLVYIALAGKDGTVVREYHFSGDRDSVRSQTVDAALDILNEEIESNKASIDRIQQLNSDIEKITVNLTELKTQIKPLKEKKASYEFKLKASIEYSKELEEHKRMYEKIDTLKYYCSPTTGIQLLFANMYLNKILDSANRILSGLFGGIFALLPLVVSENEFRIPVAVNGGINHDDITSMSSAQISLISMIISIALLSQTSTKLNIIVGDEIDAPFDSENRREFISILYQLMYMVNASQCVLITHNSEIPMDDCDIILLKSDNDVITTGNIIWSYR